MSVLLWKISLCSRRPTPGHYYHDYDYIYDYYYHYYYIEHHFAHLRANKVPLACYRTLRARMALRMAMTDTPTSAKTAHHMEA